MADRQAPYTFEEITKTFTKIGDGPLSRWKGIIAKNARKIQAKDKGAPMPPSEIAAKAAALVTVRFNSFLKKHGLKLENIKAG